jgi:hypothetical protein
MWACLLAKDVLALLCLLPLFCISC